MVALCSTENSEEPPGWKNQRSSPRVWHPSGMTMRTFTA